METLKIIHTGYGLLTNESKDKLLIVLNRSGNWSLPGGRQESFETLEKTVSREFLEETGLKVTVSNLVFMSEVVKKGFHDFFFTYRVKLSPGQRYNDSLISLADDIEDFEWVNFKIARERMPWYGDISKIVGREGIETDSGALTFENKK